MELFLQTFQVVCGILCGVVLPFILVGMTVGFMNSVKLKALKTIRQTEELKKMPPFDDEAEFYAVPNESMVGVRLFKDGKKVWDGAVFKVKMSNLL